MSDSVERLLDALSHCTTSERAEAVAMLLKDDRLGQIREQVRQISAEDKTDA